MEKPDFVDRVCDLLAYRFDQYVDRWQVIAALIVAIVLLLMSLGIYIRGQITARPKVIQAAPSVAATHADKGSKTANGAVGSDQSANVYVYVCGAVNKAGVYRVSPSTRLTAAIALAGGLASDADAASVNLAKKVTDGERIYIPKIGENKSSGNLNNNASGPDANASGSASSSQQPSGAWNVDGKLNLNAATADDLDKLPGIGPAFTTRILDYRQKHNGFTDIAQLKNIQGIGPKTYAKLKPLVYIE